jgi:hypothetical protein
MLKLGWGYSSMVEHLSSIHKTLGSISNTGKKKDNELNNTIEKFRLHTDILSLYITFSFA